MHLTIVYDGECGFCRWCRDWLATQPLLVDVTFRPSADGLARQHWSAVKGYGEELLVADDDGNVWIGVDAFVMALWATAAHRDRARHLTGTVARAMLHQLSQQRARLSGVVSAPCDDGGCAPG